jgi:hypothetical protein
MREAGTGLKSAWRMQITGAGLGTRLANSIRLASFPKAGESLNAAALVWSNAPVIVGAHDTGPLIRSRNGFWLAIPTAAAGKSSRGTPVRHDQGVDGQHPFPDAQAEERSERNGAERAGLQHQANGRPARSEGADAGHAGLVPVVMHQTGSPSHQGQPKGRVRKRKGRLATAPARSRPSPHSTPPH